MKEKLNIGIIDDYPTKRFQIIESLIKGNVGESSSHEKKNKYRDYELIPIEVEITRDINKTVETLLKMNLHCILIDYKLSSFQNIPYTGVRLAKEIESKRLEFPVFILTAYEDDVYSKEIFNSYQIIDIDQYLQDDAKRLEVISKIIEQILKYRKQINESTKELKELLKRKGESAKIDSKIIELDNFLESTLNKELALSPKLKKELLEDNKLDQLLSKIDLIIEKSEADNE